MNKTIMGFDWARTSLKANLAKCRVSVADALDSVASAQLAICHPDSNDEEAWENMLRASNVGDIRVRTSTGTRAGHQHAVIDGVIVLELQMSHDPDAGGVTAEEWGVILEELDKDGVALAIATGQTPTSLAKYFRPGWMEVLPALSILCQGYLVVHAKHGVGKNLPKSLQEASEQLIMSATSVEKVREHDFWNVFDEEDREKLVEAATVEWDAMNGSGELDDVATLIRSLPLRERPLVTKDVSMVSKAYESIVARTNAKRDK